MTSAIPEESDSIAGVSLQTLLKYVPKEEIPATQDLFSAAALAEYVEAIGEPPFSLIAVGDIMLTGRARRFIREKESGYPFDAVLPILRTAPIVMGNLEGPLTRKGRKPTTRNYSYRVDPTTAEALRDAGINVVSLANNHLLDCGRQAVVETLEALALAGVAPLGAGRNEKEAHAPIIMKAGNQRIGLLGYYWNQRCAATPTRAGGAMDSAETLEADIRGLQERVDRVVVAFHWGIPYTREPLAQDREKAHLAVDYGADVVVGHHPHVVQPLEVYRGRPIFYSVGNFAFGSGNSRAEGLLIGTRFEETRTIADIYPLYVKNRDPRVAYQPKVLRGDVAERKLRQLAEMSGPSAVLLEIKKGMGRLDLPSASGS